MTLGPGIVAMAWLERFHFSFTNPLIVFRTGAVLLLRHPPARCASHCNRDEPRHATAELHSSLSRHPRWETGANSSRPTTGSRFGRCTAVWVGVLLLLYPACLFSRGSSSVATIGGSRISDLLQTTRRELQRDARRANNCRNQVYTPTGLLV